MASQSTKSRNVILVLGMHRSGTSALTRVMNLLGVDLGNQLVAPREDNPRGYWEHEQIVEIHDALLAEFGHTWYSPCLLPERWWLEPVVDKYRRRLLEVIERDFGQSPLWGLKDPRLTRLIPLWLSVLSEIELEPRFIIVVRHPLEVAKSLRNRNGFPLVLGLLMWLKHNLQAERDSAGYRRVYVAYSDVLQDCHTCMSRISSKLEIEWSHSVEEAQRDIASFLSVSLKHFDETDQDLQGYGRLGYWVATTFKALMSEIRDSDSSLEAELVAVRNEVAEGMDGESLKAIERALLELVKEFVKQSYEFRSKLDASEYMVYHHDIMIAWQKDLLAQRDNLIEFEESQLEQKDNLIQHQQNELAQRDNLIESQKDELRKRDSLLQDLRAQVDEERQQIKSLKNSWSWRLTEALQRVRRSLSD
jgi:O-antigen biosynthesis protein